MKVEKQKALSILKLIRSAVVNASEIVKAQVPVTAGGALGEGTRAGRYGKYCVSLAS